MNEKIRLQNKGSGFAINKVVKDNSSLIDRYGVKSQLANSPLDTLFYCNILKN